MSIIGSHSIFLVHDLIDACNLCIWFFWSLAVYFLYTWVAPFLDFELNFHYLSPPQKKNDSFLYFEGFN